MIAGSADGVLLPPYVCYKASNLYDTWTEGGIHGMRYNRTSSGWFTTNIFEDWFLKTVVPYLKKLSGPKILLGDNLCSHVSQFVIEKCEELDTKFVLLPPNATHLLQPLDVAFFRPVKIAWRKCLDEWKKTHLGVLPKSDFPGLLKKTLEKVESIEDNLKAGFRACGIVPFDPQQVLKRIVDRSDNTTNEAEAWTSALTTVLQTAR